MASAALEKPMRHKKKSKVKDILRRFRRNKTAMLGAVILLVLLAGALLAGVLTPYGFDEQNLQDRKQPPSIHHLMGTDDLGRDVFSRILYGGRVSLKVGLISVSISVLFGGVLGVAAGFYGGRRDTVIMRFVDVLMAIPGMILSISICAALGPGMFNTMLAVGIGSIPNYARVFRSAVMTVVGQEYIEASRTMGARNRRLIWKHVLPNSMAPVIVQASLGVANAVVTAASLSFIGLGVQPPNPEWGAMLSYGRPFIRDYPHMVLFPGIAIMLTVLSLNLLGDGLRDALDPRLKQ